jgi:AraC-like DNA-binding protein
MLQFEYINEGYREKIKVEELAALCNLSTNYFSTVFKQHTGYSTKEYIIRIRIEKALFTEKIKILNNRE